MSQHLADVLRFWGIVPGVAVKPEVHRSGHVAVHLNLLHGYLVPALRRHWQRDSEMTVHDPPMAGPAENLTDSLMKNPLPCLGLSYPRHSRSSSIVPPRRRTVPLHPGLSATNTSGVVALTYSSNHDAQRDFAPVSLRPESPSNSSVVASK
jgi:hypothetical protein